MLETWLSKERLLLNSTPRFLTDDEEFTEQPSSVRQCFSTNHIIKFADDTTVVGLITNNDESAYRREVAQLTEWCKIHNLSLNTNKTKEMVIDTISH